MTVDAKLLHGVTDLVHPDVRMNGPRMEGDVHLCLLVGRQEARSREGSKVRSQGSHVKGVLGAHIPTVLHLQTLLCLHHTHAAASHRQQNASTLFQYGRSKANGPE